MDYKLWVRASDNKSEAEITVRLPRLPLEVIFDFIKRLAVVECDAVDCGKGREPITAVDSNRDSHLHSQELAEKIEQDLRAAEARAEASFNLAQLWQHRLERYPEVVTELVRGYGIDVSQKQITKWLMDKLSYEITLPEEERAALRCPSCSCVVDERGQGSHSAADCIFMQLVDKERAEARTIKEHLALREAHITQLLHERQLLEEKVRNAAKALQ